MAFSAAVAEVPVCDVAAAQAEYRDRMGFEVAWTRAEDGIGAVAHGDCAVFFRATSGPIVPVVLWIFAEDLEAAYSDFEARGAQVLGPIAQMPWGLRQFTVRDSSGHLLHFHHDV